MTDRSEPRPRRVARWSGARLIVGCVAAAVLVTSCSLSSESASTELDRDPADLTVPGPSPTAPVEDPDGIGSGAAAFIAELESLSDETDLCRIVTGAALQQLTSGELNVAGLAGSPAGLTQVLVIVDSTFAHLVTIAPPDLTASMSTIQDAWSRAARVPANAPDSDAQIAAILSAPEMVAALRALGTWTALNCAPPTTTTPA